MCDINEMKMLIAGPGSHATATHIDNASNGRRVVH